MLLDIRNEILLFMRKDEIHIILRFIMIDEVASPPPQKKPGEMETKLEKSLHILINVDKPIILGEFPFFLYSPRVRGALFNQPIHSLYILIKIIIVKSD